MLIDIIELIMGVVVNCEDKQEYIERILFLEDKTQEDLKKLIERSLQRLQFDFAESSFVSEAPSSVVALQKNVDALEKEKT